MTTVEITATAQFERFRFANDEGDCLILDSDYVEGPRPNGEQSKAITVKVARELPERRIRIHGTYRFYGRWKDYRNPRSGETEKQFHCDAYVEAAPASRPGVIKYLVEHGRGLNVGRARATKIWELFGSDGVKIAREQPETIAAAIKGLKPEDAVMLSERLQAVSNREACMIELIGLLDSRGLPKATAQRCLSLWGNQAADFIRSNPYRLMQFRGCGFKLTDSMYLDLGHDPGRLKRQALCAWHSIASDTGGSTWFRVEHGIEGVRQNIHGAEPRPGEALKLAKRAGIIETIRTDGPSTFAEEGGRVWIAEAKNARNERFIARHLADSHSEAQQWPAPSDIDGLSDHQWEKLNDCRAGSVAILGGSPGTGKTYTAAALIRLLVERYGADSVKACAPTGKAAVRLSEALNEYGVGIKARTIHSLLKVESAENGWRFKHGESDPLDCRFLVVDETSMVPTDLMASLLAARAKGTHLLFVGDVNQLPPVGHGAPLRDMIDAGVPYGELREIRRNSGGIVRACADIRDGKPFQCEGNLELLHCVDPAPQVKACFEVFERAKADGLDPIWDVQITVPLNAKSKVSRRELNKLLQERLNKNPGVKGSPFRVGDKLVNLENAFFTATEFDQDSEENVQNDKGEVYVANGELGSVLEVRPGYTVIRLDNPRRIVRVPRGNQGSDGANSDESSTGCSWDLGYALTVHKCQGSEWPRVAVILDEYPGARMVCDRSWVYTAISRAKDRCYLVGKMETAKGFCRKRKIFERKTFLAELYKRELSRLILAEI